MNCADCKKLMKYRHTKLGPVTLLGFVRYHNTAMEDGHGFHRDVRLPVPVRFCDGKCGEEFCKVESVTEIKVVPCGELMPLG